MGGWEAKAFANGATQRVKVERGFAGKGQAVAVRKPKRAVKSPVYEQMPPPVALISDRMEETSVPPPSLPLRPSGKAIHFPRFMQDLPNPYNYLFFSISGTPAATSAPSKIRAVEAPGRCPLNPFLIFPSILCSWSQAKFCSMGGGNLYLQDWLIIPC